MFREDLGAFLVDFGVIAEYGAIRARVVFDAPDATLLGDRVQSTTYTILFRADELAGLAHGDPIKVDGVDYSVITVSNVDDGLFRHATLSRMVTPN